MRVAEFSAGKGRKAEIIYRDMTPEEIEEMQQQIKAIPPHEPTLEDKVDALMQYMGLTGRWNGSVFEVIKEEMPSGDYTNPIYIPKEGIEVQYSKWYYVIDKEMPREAMANAFVTQEDFFDSTWFDFAE